MHRARTMFSLISVALERHVFEVQVKFERPHPHDPSSRPLFSNRHTRQFAGENC